MQEFHVVLSLATREQGRDLTQSNDKSPYTEMSKRQHDNTKTSPKSLITQRLRTYYGRSDGVPVVLQLLWLTGLWTKSSHSLQQPCNQNNKHLKICK